MWISWHKIETFQPQSQLPNKTEYHKTIFQHYPYPEVLSPCWTESSNLQVQNKKFWILVHKVIMSSSDSGSCWWQEIWAWIGVHKTPQGGMLGGASIIPTQKRKLWQLDLGLALKSVCYWKRQIEAQKHIQGMKTAKAKSTDCSHIQKIIV